MADSPDALFVKDGSGARLAKCKLCGRVVKFGGAATNHAKAHESRGEARYHYGDPYSASWRSYRIIRSEKLVRQKQVWRYYCDFCRKAGCGKGAMLKHEAHCCSNPQRVCRMCALMQNVQTPMAELIAALETGGEAALRQAIVGESDWSDACPVCVLATMIQVRKKMGSEAYYQSGLDFNFDFKKESQSVLAECSRDQYENVGGTF